MAYAAFILSLDSYEALSKVHVRDFADEAEEAAKQEYLDAMLQSGNWIDRAACEEAYEDDEDNGRLEAMSIEVAK